MRLILQEDTQRAILAEDIWLFEDAILQDAAVKPLEMSGLSEFLIRFRRKFRSLTGMERFPATKLKYLEDPLNDPKSLFAILMGIDKRKYLPHADRTSHARMIYLFDAWPKEYQRIVRFVTEYRIDHVFVSASQSAEDLNALVNKKMFHYVPEGVDPSVYRYTRYDAKDIDVLALGRKYDRYHERILPALQRRERTYLYEVLKGHIIFPDREGLIDGLARTKISICVPGNITHPERSGHVETMTMRYLQSMASKCLIVGHAPAEMIELFGYNPVIEIDWDHAEDQIEDILQRFHLHIPLIERNYKEVLSNHTWNHRFHQIKQILANPQKMIKQKLDLQVQEHSAVKATAEI
jgi:hypothetical protein